MVEMKKMKLYLPKKLVELLHDKLETLPPFKRIEENNIIDIRNIKNQEFEKFNYDINKFYFILNILLQPKQYGIFKTKEEKGITYIPICSTFLKKKIGKDYNDYIIYLLKYRFIYQYYNNNYTYVYNEKGKCNSYCISSNILEECLNINNTYIYSGSSKEENTNTSLINIKNLSFSKNKNFIDVYEIEIDKSSKIFKDKKKKYELELDRNRKSKPHLKAMSKYFRKNLKIDFNNAVIYAYNFFNEGKERLESKLNSNEITQYQYNKHFKTLGYKFYHRINSIYNIEYGKKNRTLKFDRSKTNKRVYTNLNMMSKDIRPFIIGYNDMAYLDLSNSQPVLFNVILKRHYNKASIELKSEIERYYTSTISGKWYEYLGDILKEKDREECKKTFMKIIYSKNESYKGIKEKFSKNYPKLNALISKIKSKNHNKLAIELQRYESNIFIDEICKLIYEQGIIPYPMHDGVLVPKECLEITYQIMRDILSKVLGSVPVISIDDVKRFYYKSDEEIKDNFNSFFKTDV